MGRAKPLKRSMFWNPSGLAMSLGMQHVDPILSEAKTIKAQTQTSYYAGVNGWLMSFVRPK